MVECDCIIYHIDHNMDGVNFHVHMDHVQGVKA